MFKISDVSLSVLKESKYIKPYQMHYKENGVKKAWDMIKVHQSVYIIIFNVTRKVLVCVRQFRPAVYYNSIPEEERDVIDTEKYPAELGLTLEICAGIVDKNLPLIEIAREEVHEECGYDVPVDKLEKILTCRQGALNGNFQTMYYTEVTDSMKTGKGGGLESEGECIEVVELTLEEAKKCLETDNLRSGPSFLFGLTWFFLNKASKFT
ncbi:uridine diphosphate glucose pyrophosphatase NUDT14 [Nilaparvata lugens]|uniref:uridine diphosphate glucose pyrophosphatase NUDT14 n=1 Tax=Nilaparvata lugens TaxID=108931 RepID=UPI000B99AB99|nr:uridine diphosphate glucose pyrophosphatase NUDT14 [Nilaparvata lugens]